MSKVTDALTQKIGPAPAWVYGLSLGVGINVFRWYRNRSAPAATEVSDGTEGAAGATGGTAAPAPTTGYSLGDPAGTLSPPGSVGGYPVPTGYQANPGGVVIDSGGVSSAPVTSSAPLNNGDWSRRAFDVLVAEGNAPTAVQDALSKYLTGDPITAQQEALVSLALRRVGSPPEGAPSITRAAPAPAAQAPTAPAQPAPIPAAPPVVPFVRPSWLGQAKFVKGSGPAIYLVTDAGLEWVPSEEAFLALGGSFGRPGQGPINFLQVPDSALRPLKRIGTLPPREADPSLP